MQITVTEKEDSCALQVCALFSQLSRALSLRTQPLTTYAVNEKHPLRGGVELVVLNT